MAYSVFLALNLYMIFILSVLSHRLQWCKNLEAKSNGLGVMSNLVLLVTVAPLMSQSGSYSHRFSSI